MPLFSVFIHYLQSHTSGWYMWLNNVCPRGTRFAIQPKLEIVLGYYYCWLQFASWEFPSFDKFHPFFL